MWEILCLQSFKLQFEMKFLPSHKNCTQRIEVCTEFFICNNFNQIPMLEFDVSLDFGHFFLQWETFTVWLSLKFLTWTTQSFGFTTVFNLNPVLSLVFVNAGSIYCFRFSELFVKLNTSPSICSII